jgi:hypothetical protein
MWHIYRFNKKNGFLNSTLNPLSQILNLEDVPLYVRSLCSCVDGTGYRSYSVTQNDSLGAFAKLWTVTISFDVILTVHRR